MEIVDIEKQMREDAVDIEKQMREDALKGLSKGHNEKEVPDFFMYDHVGSQLFEEITTLPTYYVEVAEVQILKEHSQVIARSLDPETIIVDLGCGSAKKTVILLQEFKQVHGRLKYVGIDASATLLNEAKTNLSELFSGDGEIELIEDDYLNGLKKVRESNPQANLCIAWFGISICTITMEEAISFMKQLVSISNSNCKLLIFLDMWKDPAILKATFKDEEGLHGKFVINGMKNALSSVAGKDTALFNTDSWVHEVVVNPTIKRVEIYVMFKDGLKIEDHNIEIREGERVMMVFLTTYTVEKIKKLGMGAGCNVIKSWGDDSHYTCRLFEPSV